MNTWTVLKDLVKKNYLIKNFFYSSVKDGTTTDNGEKSNGEKNDEDYLTCKTIWDKFNLKNMWVVITIII